MMNQDATFSEICPVCSKPTAPHLFRTLNNVRACFFCTQKAEKSAQDEKAAELDRRYHGGSGWFWKHVLKVGACAIALLFLRMALIHWLISHGQ